LIKAKFVILLMQKYRKTDNEIKESNSALVE